MRIAQLAPLYESVPPRLYGGTERVVSFLTEELVRQGHEVTLFAAGDSRTAARLVPMCEQALRLDDRCRDPFAFHFLMMEAVVRRRHEFDIIHSHIDTLGFVIGRRTGLPLLATMHGRLDLWELPPVFREYAEMPLVSISDAQRRPLPEANWLSTVYHGLPDDLYACTEKGGDYLVYVGRVSPEKKVDAAVRIAVQAGIPLKIAAKVDRDDRDYFEAEIRPLLAHPLIDFLGEVGELEKGELLRGALAFLHPVDWPEPFGLAMIEAMACGTPVIARRRGSIPEVVDHGITGFVFEQDEEAVACLRDEVPSFSRRRCREHFEQRFSARRMAASYLAAYRAVLAGVDEDAPTADGEERCLKLAG
ncbi:MAG: glycosyltransferase family 4 protein [Desulfobacteraceae bacterium]|nr:glycosyltransferase family 4 protein [Desulfobacteraceae bacterium]